MHKGSKLIRLHEQVTKSYQEIGKGDHSYTHMYIFGRRAEQSKKQPCKQYNNNLTMNCQINGRGDHLRKYLLCFLFYEWILSSPLIYIIFIFPFQGMNQSFQQKTQDCEQYPADQIVRIDDDYFFKSGYFQMHDVKFQLPQVTYGNQEIRKNYNITKELKKYFAKRYFFFTLFDQGIQLDNQSWYSVIAQPISIYLCERLKFSGVKNLLQPFCGVGGITVHAAGNFERFVVNDIDESKIKMLKNNLSVYSKGLNLLTIHNKDALKIKSYEVDAVLICPPWGGVNISEYSFRDLDQIMQPKLSHILNHFKKFSKNIVLQMPKNTNLSNLLKIINMCFLTPVIKIQKIYVDGRISQLFIYIGDMKFTGFSPQIFNTMIKDSKKQITNIKQAKKDLKKKLKQEKFDIFEEIYCKNKTKLNNHIFFDDSQSH